MSNAPLSRSGVREVGGNGHIKRIIGSSKSKAGIVPLDVKITYLPRSNEMKCLT